MASHCEIAEEEYVKESKDRSENENMKKRTEYWKKAFKKWELKWKKLPSKFRRVQEQCFWPNTITVLYIQKCSSFGLSVIE